jgi:hypothetical protein
MLEHLDRIVLSTQEVFKIHDWVSENKDRYGVDLFRIPFDEILIIINNFEINKNIGEIYLHVQSKDNVIRFMYYDAEFKVKLIDFGFDTETYEFNPEADEVGYSWLNYSISNASEMKLSYEEIKKTTDMLFLMATDIFMFVTFNKEIIKSEKVTKVKSKKKKHKKKSKNNAKREVQITSTVYTFDFNKFDTIKREIERHIESWNVRGHWRYIKKTGKRVWVKPHVKGEGKVETKIYKV